LLVRHNNKKIPKFIDKRAQKDPKITQKVFFLLHHATHTRTRTNCCVIAIHPPYIDHLLATKEEKKEEAGKAPQKIQQKTVTHRQYCVLYFFLGYIVPLCCLLPACLSFVMDSFFSHSKRFYFYGRGYEGIFCA
jgi:hypothetical protein